MGKDTRELQRDVDAARDQLGDTVEALAQRANAPKRVKNRVRESVARLKQRVNRRY